jgi:pyruvate,water dikinase
VQIELAAGKVTRVPPWTNPAALTTVFSVRLCAAGVPNATNRIPTGTLLEVDGSSGKVTVLEG